MSTDGAIAIAATFTAEPVAESLRFWLKRLDLPARIAFAPYNQVVQTLLDTRSVFALNRNGLNVVLLRFEDWERFHGDSDPHARNRELIAALATASSNAASPILVCVCPPSPGARSDPRSERDLETGLAGFSTIRFLSPARLSALYPVENCFDASTDELGHIPYTPEAFAALGAAIVRVFHSFKRPPYKVVVLDCDNTLWRGVCGENGPRGIVLDPPSRALQRFMKAQQAEGMLLCVVSKNAAEDVEATFEAHPEMPLRRSDFVGWRVNWRPKSENVHSLAAELSLGLDSFIFVDDNPMEAAEVRAACPGVLALTLPDDRDLIPRFLDHVWAFDKSAITAEDRKRSDMYRENALRSGLLAEALSYADFLACLELQVEIREPRSAEEIARAAQLTQRTNQFNCTTRRFTESDIRPMHVLTTFVRDRFGAYGQTGLLMYEEKDGLLRVHTFLLSCRVLGKGVEHAMLAHLGRIAVARSLRTVEIEYLPTPKNTPVRDFLNSLDAENPEGSYRLPAATAADIRFSPAQSEQSIPDAATVSPTRGSGVVDYEWIAMHCRDGASILKAVNDSQEIRVASRAVTQPTDDMQRRLTRIWERVLRISPIGIDDDFFALGGDSLTAVRMLADVEAITGRRLPLVTLVEAPTIAKLADLLGGGRNAPRRNCVVPIRTSGTRRPFFCVHGVGGNILEYVGLARLMDADQPFYGIQALGLNGTPPARRFTIEELAAHYIGEVREVRREGPYHLGGSSFGGLVAYEMARQLAAAGEGVALVALIDTSAPGCPVRAASALRNRIDAAWYRAMLHWKNALVLNGSERLDYIRQKTRRLFNNRFREDDSGARGAAHLSAANYVPGDYSGDITIFRATEQPPWILSDRALGWTNLVKGKIEIYDTPGHHADLVRLPRARILARQLDDALTRAQVIPDTVRR